jgi:hypothetical protein
VAPVDRPSYSLEEARGLVPEVRAVLLALAMERRRLGHAPPAELREATAGLLAHLESLGVELRDLDEGLVDIPTVRDGELAWFCWRLADPQLGWWHTTREGFAARRPV